MARNIINEASSPALLVSTRSFQRRSDGSHGLRGWILPNYQGILWAAAITAAISSTSAFAQPALDTDRCKVTNSDRQTENKQTAPAANSNSGDKLSDCGGVLKPPAVGDSKLEKPAPKVGRTPVIKPGDTQNGQPSNQQPSK